MQFVYTGPFESVDIPALGITVMPGEPFDATGDDAKSLLDQPDNYTRTDKKEN